MGKIAQDSAVVDDLLSVTPGEPSWLDDAVCSQTDPEAFFPGEGGSNAVAKKICLACPVMLACRTWAVKTGQEHGIWGAMSVRERRRWAEENGITEGQLMTLPDRIVLAGGGSIERLAG